MKIVDVPTKQAGLLNTDRCREANVTIKLDVIGDFKTADELISFVGRDADEVIGLAIQNSFTEGVSVEGATPLVNRDIVESWFRVEGI
jgi:hypothetical protein